MNRETQQEHDGAFGWVLAQFLIRQAAHTVEVFLRYGFGERYFEFMTFYGVLRTAGLAGILSLVFFFRSPAWTAEGRSFFQVLLVYVWMTVLHQAWSRRERTRGRLVHSRFPGFSFAFWRRLPFPPPFVRLALEPVLAFAFGHFALAPRNPVIGHWVQLASLCMGVVGLYDAARRKTMTLDSLDSQVEAENFSAVLAGGAQSAAATPHEATQTASHIDQARGGESVDDAIARLAPEVRALMKEPERRC